MITDNVVRHVLDDGAIHYRNAAGKLHRTDGPAVVRPDGTKEWYQNGKPHREDGPAVVQSDGTELWYRNGGRHREDGPAVMYPDGTKKWYLDGTCHREGGPAVVYHDGTEKWFLDGKLHRTDGPAVVRPDGTEKWFLNGKLHRTDGPAVVDAAGNYEYWIDGASIVSLSKITGDVYCLEWDSDWLHQYRLSAELVVKVMSDKGFGSVEEFGSWLAFEVLGEEAVPVITRVRERGTTVLPVLEEYLRNHEDYEGLPFSWWYPIVEGAVNQ